MCRGPRAQGKQEVAVSRKGRALLGTCSSTSHRNVSDPSLAPLLFQQGTMLAGTSLPLLCAATEANPSCRKCKQEESVHGTTVQFIDPAASQAFAGPGKLLLAEKWEAEGDQRVISLTMSTGRRGKDAHSC